MLRECNLYLKVIFYSPHEKKEVCMDIFIVLLVAAPKPKGAKLKLKLTAEEWDHKLRNSYLM